MRDVDIVSRSDVCAYQVIDLERSNEKNYYKRFRMYLRQQKYKEALSDLSAALSIKPDYDVVAAHRAKLHLRLGKCREATQDFHLLRSIAPTNPDLVLMDRAAKCAAGIQAAQESVQVIVNWKRPSYPY
jgi:tetratricopeptide (TPR) repeat protein